MNGVFTTLGMFLVAQRLGGQIAAILAGLIWAVFPYITFHDRLALHDPFISCFLIWSGFLIIEHRVHPHWFKTFFSGLLLGLAIAVKITALTSSLWVLCFAYGWLKVKNNGHAKPLNTFVMGIMLPLVVLLALLIPHVPELIAIGRSNGRHFTGASVDLLSRWQLLVTNMTAVKDWIGEYGSLPFQILLVFVFIAAIVFPSRVKIILIFSFLMNSLLYAYVLHFWVPRYLIPNLIPLVMLIALVFAECARRMRRGRQENFFGWTVSAVVTVIVSVLLLGSLLQWTTMHRLFATNPMSVHIPALIATNI